MILCLTWSKFFFFYHKIRVHCFMFFFFFRLFYKPLLDRDLEIRIKDCRNGLFCAALFGAQWHRAKILEIFYDSYEVKLLYIDYATVMKVTINQIKYLRKEFSDVPSMVYRGCLSKVVPIKTRFSKSAVNCFYSKVYDKLLAGQASYIDHEEQIVYMVLNDTSTEEDFCINNHLFERGYGKLSETDDFRNKKITVSFFFLYFFFLLGDRNFVFIGSLVYFGSIIPKKSQKKLKTRGNS